jgi:hypothetical protein
MSIDVLIKFEVLKRKRGGIPEITGYNVGF